MSRLCAAQDPGPLPPDTGKLLGPQARVAIDRWTDSALAALFDPVCAACGQGLGPGRQGPVCRLCWNAIRTVSPPWCDRCGEPLKSWRTTATSHCARCLAHPPQFDQARACGLYEGPLRQIVHALKYRGHRSLGAPLGALMRQAGGGLLAVADAVVPVPLHPWRRLRRGFNQADELAIAVGLPVWRPLKRWSLRVPQAGLSGEDRRANVVGAYALSRIRARPRAGRPRRVVLIDDVMTTGATLDACSRVLRGEGVEWIGALTVARAVTFTAGSTGAAPRPRPPHTRRLLMPRR